MQTPVWWQANFQWENTAGTKTRKVESKLEDPPACLHVHNTQIMLHPDPKLQVAALIAGRAVSYQLIEASDAHPCEYLAWGGGAQREGRLNVCKHMVGGNIIGFSWVPCGVFCCLFGQGGIRGRRRGNTGQQGNWHVSRPRDRPVTSYLLLPEASSFSPQSEHSLQHLEKLEPADSQTRKHTV